MVIEIHLIGTKWLVFIYTFCGFKIDLLQLYRFVAEGHQYMHHCSRKCPCTFIHSFDEKTNMPLYVIFSWFFHSQDDNVVCVEETDKIVAALRKCGACNNNMSSLFYGFP